MDSNGKPAGQHIETFNILSERSGIPFSYKIMPIPRIKEHLKSGKTDMTVIFRREEMAPHVEFIGLVFPYNYYLVGKAGVYFDRRSLKSVKLVGFARGEEDVAKKCVTDKYASKAQMVPASNYGTLIKMLNGGRFDAAAIPSKGLKAYLDETGKDEPVIGRLFVLCENEAFLQMSKGSPHLNPKPIGKLRDALGSMRKDGTLERVAERYQEVRN